MLFLREEFRPTPSDCSSLPGHSPIAAMRRRELPILAALWAAGLISIAVSFAIIWILISQSIPFFEEVSVREFLTGTRWTPLFASKEFGVLPLLVGTLLTTTVALAVAVPIGITTAIYLSEFASPRFRETVKPMLEVLASIPTVVYGYFALVVVTPFLQRFLPDLSTFNALSAGLVMGLMIMPMVSSLSEDALYALPYTLREAAYGLGANRLQTVFRVLLPSAMPGILVAVILAMSRAIGETMIVTIAAGMRPILTFDIREPIQTITAYVVQVSMGDVPHGSIEHRTIYAVALLLFAVAFALNIISYRIRRYYVRRFGM